MTLLRRLSLLALALFGGALASAQDYPEGRPYLHIIGIKDGLPQTSVMSLSRDRRGFLWVGTADGAAYSDGSGWHQVAIPDGARSNYVQAILHASDGSTWFARQDGGVARLQGGAWSSFNTRNGFPHDRVNALAETRDPDGSSRIWAGTHGKGVACFKGGTWTVLDAKDGIPDGKVWCLRPAATRSGRSALWIGTDGGGLVRWEDGRIERFPGLPNLSVNSLAEHTTAEGSDLYVGTYGRGVAKREKEGWRFFTTRDGLPSDFITDLQSVREADGTPNLWATTLGGLARYRQGKWTSMTRRSGLPNATLYRLLATHDPGGQPRLWIGSGGHGLFRLELGGWRTLDIQNGLPDDNVWCVNETQGADGSPVLWAGTSNGLVKWSHGAWVHVVGKERIMCLAVGTDGTLWAGSLAGVYRVGRDGSITHTDDRSGLPHNRVSSMVATQGPGGRPRLWVGTEGWGLARFEEGRWTVLDERHGLPYGTINCLLETEDTTFGRMLWVGTRGHGLAGLKPDGTWIHFTMKDGLPNDNVTTLLEVHGPGGARELWLGTFGRGAARLILDQAGTRWEALDLPGHASQDIVQSIQQDRIGRIHLYSQRGILTLERTWSGPGTGFRSYLSTGEDGLPSEQINPRSGFVDRRGWLWVGTTSGLAVLNPESALLDATPKPLLLQGVVYGKDGTEDLAQDRILNYRQSHLEFRFTLVDFFKTSEHRYQSQLQGFEDRPTEWSPSGSREFTHLPPGDYAFNTWGLDASGNQSGPEVLRFSLRPEPWRSVWFIAMCLLAFAGLVALGIRWRERMLRRRNEALSAMVLSRTKDLLKSNLELQRQMKEREAAERAKADFVAAVSHELRTPLTSIRGSLGLLSGGALGALPDQARHLLDMAQRNALKLVALVNDLLDLQKVEAGKMDLVLHPIELGEFLDQALGDHAGYASTAGVTCRLDRSPRQAWVLGDAERLHQVMANLLSNATKYASGDKTVDVNVQVRDHWARVSVTNRGEPIPESFRARIFHPFEQADQGDSRTARGTGLGLHISKAIMDLHHGRIGFQSDTDATTFYIELPMIDGPGEPSGPNDVVSPRA